MIEPPQPPLERPKLPWSGYRESPDEKACTTVLHTVAQSLQAMLAEHGIASALIGGTALRLVEDLPRLSKDIDLKVTRPVAGSDERIISTVNQIDGWKARPATQRDEADGFEGVIIQSLATGIERSTSVDLIPGKLTEYDKPGVATQWLIERNGIKTYPTHVLGQLKMGTIVGDHTRRLAHDVFDIAWQGKIFGARMSP